MLHLQSLQVLHVTTVSGTISYSIFHIQTAILHPPVQHTVSIAHFVLRQHSEAPQMEQQLFPRTRAKTQPHEWMYLEPDQLFLPSKVWTLPVAGRQQHKPLMAQLFPLNRGNQQHELHGVTPKNLRFWDGTCAVKELLHTTRDELLLAKPWKNAR